MTDTFTIYHNPRCSKSRATLELLEQQGVNIETVEYLKSPPSATTIKRICSALGCRVGDIVRRGEQTYKELNVDAVAQDDDALAALISDNPILLERPIVLNGDRAAVGRPPENVMTLFS